MKQVKVCSFPSFDIELDVEDVLLSLADWRLNVEIFVPLNICVPSQMCMDICVTEQYSMGVRMMYW